MSEYKREDLETLGAKWMERIKASEKREETWSKQAGRAEAAYICGGDEEDTKDVPDFNILHSNVETIVPAIYNSTPAPDIRPRHNNTDEDAKQLADALERAIATQIDDDAMDTEVEALAQDSVLAGRGVTRIKFDADIAEETISNERVIYENVSWRDYREGPAKRWSAVPWVAYRHSISQEELDQLTDEALASVYDDNPTTTEELDVDVWEIWDRDTRNVLFLVEQSCRVIKIEADPMGLSGFFPQPEPVQPIKATGKRTPVCPYTVYLQLAQELDVTTRRINAITKGLKLRGLIVSGSESIERLSQAGDNELVPVDTTTAGAAAQGGLERAIAWWPVDRAIQVLAQLYQQREATKQAIYEITGISDIVRGASDSRETAAAQQIKTQWGSQRIKRLQRMVQSHVRDLFKLTAEVMVGQFTPEGLQRAAGVQLNEGALAMVGGALDHFRIDVESDSTVRADLTRQRGEMSEFLNSTAGFFQAMAPIVGQSPEMAAPTAEIFAAFTRTFQLGKQAEDAIDQMSELGRKAAQTDRPDPAKEAMEAEQQAKQAELQIKMQDSQSKMQESQSRAHEAQARAQMMMQELALKEQQIKIQMVKDRFELALKAKELGLAINEQELAQQKTEIDTLLRIEELDMERDQRRPVAI